MTRARTWPACEDCPRPTKAAVDVEGRLVCFDCYNRLVRESESRVVARMLRKKY